MTSQDPNIDGLLAILTPQAMSDPTATAQALTQYAKVAGKPVLASWMGGEMVEPGERILDQAGIATFAYPDTAAQTFTAMWRSYYNLQALYETPTLPAGGETAESARERADGDHRDRASRGTNRSYRSRIEADPGSLRHPDRGNSHCRNRRRCCRGCRLHRLSRRAQAPFQDDHPQDRRRRRAAQFDQRRGRSQRLSRHRVRRLPDAGAEHFQGVTVQPMVKLDGYELIIGSSLDPQFGPVLLFGTGGQLVEVFKDRSLGLPPLNTTLARRMMEQTKIITALKGVRGRQPVDLAALEQLLVRFSYLVVEQPWIKELDINPLLASADRLLALDARVIVHGHDIRDAEIPGPAIRPYPTQYITRGRPKTALRLSSGRFVPRTNRC